MKATFSLPFTKTRIWSGVSLNSHSRQTAGCRVNAGRHQVDGGQLESVVVTRHLQMLHGEETLRPREKELGVLASASGDLRFE